MLPSTLISAVLTSWITGEVAAGLVSAKYWFKAVTSDAGLKFALPIKPAAAVPLNV